MQTPVAFLIFNRPDCTARVMAAIRAARPTKLLLVADGPRPDRPRDAELCAATRQVVEQSIDWPCEVLRNYAPENLGCRRRVSSGLDWVFDRVERAIILEDDCLPDPSFFPFCEELLTRYQAEEKVRMISGCNFQPARFQRENSYYFSHCLHIWGWATWRRAWQGHYALEMPDWPRSGKGAWLKEVLQDDEQARVWEQIFDRAHGSEINTWDFAWMYAILRDGGLSILPGVNLISNIGFGADATHTSTHYSPMAERRTRPLSFPLVHPVGPMDADRAADRRTFELVLLPEPRWKRLAGKLRWAIRNPTRLPRLVSSRLHR